MAMSTHQKEWLSRKEAASYLNAIGAPVGTRTLASLASKGDGPPYKLVCGRAFYRPADLDVWAKKATIYVSPEELARRAAIKAKARKRDNLPYVSPLAAAAIRAK